MARPHVRAARRNLVAGLVLNVMAAGTMVFGLAGGPNWFFLIVGAVFFLTVSVKTSQAQAEVLRIEAALLEALRDQAEQLKADSDRADYARDLRSSSAF